MASNGVLINEVAQKLGIKPIEKKIYRMDSTIILKF